jgi:hypothetical protein
LIYDRAIIGGGIFGCYAALFYAKLGYTVLLVEQDNDLLKRASSINQARIHTGLHYPRSFLTAQNSLKYFQQFSERFPKAIFNFRQIYGVSEHNSKTNIEQFRGFTRRLKVSTREINPDKYFYPGTVSGAFEVQEPTFDASILREQLREELKSESKVHVQLGSPLTKCDKDENHYNLHRRDGSSFRCKEILIASYASTNTVRRLFGLRDMPLSYELTEVILGEASGLLSDVGFTIMDGPFWSLMPFGTSGLSSLTSVGFTPILRNSEAPAFACQIKRPDCTQERIQDCTSCEQRPTSMVSHTIQQMKKHLKLSHDFVPKKSFLTIKTILKTTEVDDARPTIILREDNEKITTVFSGKISTIFDLDKELT